MVACNDHQRRKVNLRDLALVQAGQHIVKMRESLDRADIHTLRAVVAERVFHQRVRRVCRMRRAMPHKEIGLVPVEPGHAGEQGFGQAQIVARPPQQRVARQQLLNTAAERPKLAQHLFILLSENDMQALAPHLIVARRRDPLQQLLRLRDMHALLPLDPARYHLRGKRPVKIMRRERAPQPLLQLFNRTARLRPGRAEADDHQRFFSHI